jgi:hypothetical protein
MGKNFLIKILMGKNFLIKILMGKNFLIKILMGKNFLIKISMGKAPNEVGNCPFALPLVAPLSSLITSK